MKMRIAMRTMLALVVAIIFSATANAAPDADAGKKIYEKNCAACHGKDGKGIMPKMPDFSKGERMSKSDKDLLVSISGGVKGTAMPAWKGKLQDADMAAALSHIKGLSGSAVKKVDDKAKADVKKPAVKKTTKKKASKKKSSSATKKDSKK